VHGGGGQGGADGVNSHWAEQSRGVRLMSIALTAERTHFREITQTTVFKPVHMVTNDILRIFSLKPDNATATPASRSGPWPNRVNRLSFDFGPDPQAQTSLSLTSESSVEIRANCFAMDCPEILINLSSSGCATRTVYHEKILRGK
jgi:hypothetical protein